MSDLRASGVYYQIIDESFIPTSLTILEVVVPMTTTRGVVGLNRVTSQNFRDIVGFDLTYNGNYQGLSEMLSAVSYLDVMRINQNPLYGNTVFQTTGQSFSASDVDDPADLPSAQDMRTETESLTTSGKTTDLNFPVLANSVRILQGVTLVGHDDGAGAIVADASSGVAGAIDYGTGQITSFLAGSAIEVVIEFVVDRENAIAFYMSTPGAWDNLEVEIDWSRTPFQFAAAASVNMGVATVVGTLILHQVNGVIVARESSGNFVAESGFSTTGVITRDGSLITSFTLVDPPAGQGTLVVDYVPNGSSLYELQTYRVISATASQLLTTEIFSTDSGADNFVDGVEFEYVRGVLIAASIDSSILEQRSELLNGSNGTVPLASEIDTSPLSSSAAVAIVMNGLIDKATINLFLQRGDALQKSVIFDVPAFTDWLDVLSWQADLFATEYAQGQWIPDQVETSAGTINLFPSVNWLKGMAKMISDTGSLNFPQAGYDFFSVVATNLLETNIGIYRDAAKVNKINYQYNGFAGPVLWEQRTRNAGESDLTYANGVWTIRNLASDMQRFMEPQAFKIITPTNLNVWKTGLETITRRYIENNFVFTASVDVPTFQEVIDGGSRTVIINIAVQLAADGEVFDLRIRLSNTAVV